MSPKIIRSSNGQFTCLGGLLMKARAHFDSVKNFTYEPDRQIDQVMVTWSPRLRITRGSNQEVSNRGSKTNCAQKE